MKISVIVPIYNKVEYIERCFRQLLAQDMDDIEVVAVDDGSTDGSGDLCDQLSGDARLRVFHTPNQGVTAARRYGVEASISFLWIAMTSSFRVPFTHSTMPLARLQPMK